MSKRFNGGIFIAILVVAASITTQAFALTSDTALFKKPHKPFTKLTPRDLIKIPLNGFKIVNYPQNVIDASGSDVDTLLGNFSFDGDFGTDAKNIDTVGSGLPDIVKFAFGLDPSKKDFDGDGHNDKQELLSGYDPMKARNTKLKYDQKLIGKNKGKIVLVDTKLDQTAWFVDKKGTLNYLGSNAAEISASLRKLSLSPDGVPLPKVPCSKSKTPEQKTQCFLDNFKLCKRATFLYAENMRYDITGWNKDGSCNVRATVVKSQKKSLYHFPENMIGASMNCHNDTKKSFVSQMNKNCSGTLSGFFAKIDEKLEASEVAVTLPTLKEGFIDCDAQYQDTNGRNSCLATLFSKCTPGRVSYSFDPSNSSSVKGAAYYIIHGAGSDAHHCSIEVGFYDHSKKMFEDMEQTGKRPDICNVSNNKEFVSALSDAQDAGGCVSSDKQTSS